MILLGVLGGLFTTAYLACGQSWDSQAAPALAWQTVASSADGNLLLAAANGSSIYISTNAGATWNPTATPTNLWQGVAVSANGVKMVGAAGIAFRSGDPPSISGDGLIYVSTNSGATWSPASAPNNAWSCVAASADGTRLVAAAPVLRSYLGAVVSGDGLIYRSTNSGANWFATSAPNDNWKSIACSSDGTRLVAAVDISVNTGNGLIYVSTNSGLTWVQTLTGNGFVSVASSADGTRLVAADPCGCTDVNPFTGDCLGYYCPGYDQHIYVSTNSGATWTVSGAPGARWQSVVSSADGLILAGAYSVPFSPGGLSLSQDGGANWAPTVLGGHSWTAIGCSADGQRFVAASWDGLLTTLPYLGPWRLAATPTTPASPWSAVASSEDGSKLVATADGSIYTSTNYGISWAITSAALDIYHSVACSADGARLVAASSFVNCGYSAGGGAMAIYTSTNSGATWVQTTAPSLGWAGVASSADGIRVAAAPQSGNLYISSDSGASFTPSGPTNSWASVASSADGTRLVAASCLLSAFGTLGDGLIYISTNSGATWRPTSAPSTNWTSVASSANGSQLVAAAGDFNTGLGLIYLSRDAGVSWNPTAAPRTYWDSVASSADGTELVAVAGGPFNCLDSLANPDARVYISTDSGATWAPAEMPASGWTTATVSADGTKIVALSYLGIAGILQWPLPPPPPPPAPLLSIARSGANPRLSWIVPSARFTLQQSSHLTPPNWVDVTNPPTLNFTNLHNEVTLPAPSGSAFYRLKQ